MRHFLAALAFVLCASSVQAGPDRISFSLGSHHVNGHGFEEINPGVFLTWEKPKLHWTGGIYRNSYGRATVAATLYLPLIRWDNGNAGPFLGAAHYPKDGRRMAMHFGDVIPLAGLQVRHRNIFAQVIPGNGSYADAVITFGVTFSLE